MFKRVLKEDRGQALVVTVFSLFLLLACVALAVDVGLTFRERRRVQNAADAAATAAALNYHNTYSITSAKASGQVASSANGYTNNGSCPGAGLTCVTINMPPVNGPNTAYKAYAEAIVSSPYNTSLMGMFGFPRLTVAARAVAGNPAASKGCGFVTGSGPATFQMQGSFEITGSVVSSSQCKTGTTPPGCGIYVASTDAAAVKITGSGSGGCLNTNFVEVAGGVSGGKAIGPTGISTNLGNVAGDPFAQQLSTVSQPTASNPSNGCSTYVTDGTKVKGVTTLTITSANIGNYAYSTSTGNTVVCFQNAVEFSGGTTSTPLLMPGSSSANVIYIFENGVTFDTSSNVQFGSGTYTASSNTFTYTNGATLEVWGGTLTQNSNSNLSIYAPTTEPSQGTTNGIAILQPASNTNALQVQFGSNNEVMDGFIYAPGADVTLHDSGGGVVATGFVAKTMNIGNGQLYLPNYNSANAQTTPLTQILLVE
jgi:Flp pilus assembly protein TadG